VNIVDKRPLSTDGICVGCLHVAVGGGDGGFQDDDGVPRIHSSELSIFNEMWELWDADGSGELDMDEFGLALKMLMVTTTCCRMILDPAALSA